MPNQVRHRLTFRLERWLQRGTIYQLLAIVVGIVGVALLGGLLAWVFTPAFDDPATAIWWAFLRLTDPGYLGDDEGAFLRTLATIITVLGYVLFMGALIAILTQGLHQTMRRLESGLTPIAIEGHLLILGWTNRTASIVREMLAAEGRVERFLDRQGARSLRIVILAETVDAALRNDLRDQLGPYGRTRRVLLRSGSSLRIEHLQRVAFTKASVIVMPGADFAGGGAMMTDTRTIKTLLSVARYGQAAHLPSVVAEVFDAKKVPIALQAYPAELDVIASDAFVARLITQNVRHPGLSHAYAELLSHAHGNELYVRTLNAAAGWTLAELRPAYAGAIPLGVVRPSGGGFEPFLNPPVDFKLQRDDRVVFLARSYEDTALPATYEPTGTERAPTRSPDSAHTVRRAVLFLGWSHKVPALLREFGSYASETFEVDVLSLVPLAEREEVLARQTRSDRVQVRQWEGDYAAMDDLRRLDVHRYDNVVLLGSDWLESGEEADARTILGFVLLRSLLDAAAEATPDYRAPQVLVELMDSRNAPLFRERPGEVIISPVILSHVLAHVALRRELNAVFSELYGPGGAEIALRPVGTYDLQGRTVNMNDLQRHTAPRGEVALGVRLHAERTQAQGGLHLNPSRQATWTLEPGDEVVVLATYERT